MKGKKMAEKLITRVKRHTTAQGTQGASTLALFLETVDHGFEHNDFTPLVALIARSQSAQSRIMRGLLGVCTNGFVMAKSEKADYGHVFRKAKGANQGTTIKLDRVRDMVAAGVSIQHKDVAALYKKLAHVNPDFDPKAAAARWIKAHKSEDVAPFIAALQAAATAA
jgi:hypothetical protein